MKISFLFLSIIFCVQFFALNVNANGGNNFAEREKQARIAAEIARAYNLDLSLRAAAATTKIAATTKTSTIKTTTTATTTAKPTTTTKTTTIKTTTTPTTTTSTKSTTTITTTVLKISCPFNTLNGTCNTAYKYQSFDGTCNNLQNPTYGSSNTPYTRFLTPSYADGVNSPRSLSVSGSALPNPRLISTTIFNDQLLSEAMWNHLFTVMTR